MRTRLTGGENALKVVPRIPSKANSEGTQQLLWPVIMATNVLFNRKEALGAVINPIPNLEAPEF